MADPTAEDLARIAQERGEMFRPAWFRRLFRGKLTLGETFWGGHLGLQLVLMPLWLALIVVLPAVIPALGSVFVLAFFVLVMAISILVTRAVVLVAPGSNAGIWRWIAAGASLLLSAQSVGMLMMWLMGKL